jgi:hypothetical protein
MTSRGSGRCARVWCVCGWCWWRFERPDGLLIVRLLDVGLTIITVHPNQVKAMGRRYSVATARAMA